MVKEAVISTSTAAEPTIENVMVSVPSGITSRTSEEKNSRRLDIAAIEEATSEKTQPAEETAVSEEAFLRVFEKRRYPAAQAINTVEKTMTIRKRDE